MPEVITDNLDLWTSALLTKSTAGRGSNGKLEAYGIKKLRELILELAVRGKLLPQGDKWELTCLGELGNWAVGSGFPKSAQGNEGLEILFAKVSDMNLPENTKFIIATNHTISEATATELRVNIHAPGTVIFPKIGGAIATNKRRILTRPTAIDNNCLGISPKDGVTTDWLYLVLSNIDFSKYQAGTSVPALSQGILAKISVSLPVQTEQHRIVAKVDELMVLCDQLEQKQTHSIEAHQTLVETLLGTLTRVGSQQEFSEAWTRIASHFDTLFTTEASIDQLKQTILQLAVMGKLVPQDLNDEPASVLLEKIAEEKRRLVNEGRIRTQQALSAVKETPFELPGGWVWSRLGNLGLGSTGKTPSTGNPEYYGGEIQFIGPGQITLEGEILDSDKSLTDVGCEESVIAEPGDILMVCIGGSIGKSAIATSRIAFNQQINSIRPIFVSSELLNYVMNTPHFQTSVLERATGSATPIINRSKWEELLVPIPPGAEQHRIVAKVDELMALCDSLKARFADAQTTQLHLADAIVEQAVR